MSIALRGLTKHYGKLAAVDAIDLDVAEGEVLCLLGPSGCGKTTTLRMVAGLEHASGGEVRLNGERVNDLTARERNVAMSFQFYALYPSLTVAENIAYPLWAEGHSKAVVWDKVAATAGKLRLEAIMDRLPGQLAEGEKQRVAVARSIVRDPTCFLFDEPLSRLDVQLREEMRGEIKGVLGGLNRPTAIVTHDQLEALTMADRIAVMRAGRIEQAASPHAIFQRPANLFVAGFIGTPQMNLIPAELIGLDGALAHFAIEGGQTLAVGVDPAVGDLAPGGRVTLGARPRNLEIVADDAPDALAAVVDLIEPMGAETLAHLSDGHHDIRVVCDWRVDLSEGERVRLRFPAGAVHVFGPDERAVRGAA